MDVKTPQKTILEVRARRERLRTLMDRLEAALAAPVPGREAAWLKGVRAAFGELEVEHVELAGAVRALGERLDAAATRATAHAVRGDLLRLLGRLAQHRQLGADLLYESYVVDVSGGD